MTLPVVKNESDKPIAPAPVVIAVEGVVVPVVLDETGKPRAAVPIVIFNVDGTPFSF